MEKISRAIDVGFGSTKLTLNTGLDGEIKCSSFRSVCPVASDQQIEGFLSKPVGAPNSSCVRSSSTVYSMTAASWL